jgi:hypothetical protein
MAYRILVIGPSGPVPTVIVEQTVPCAFLSCVTSPDGTLALRNLVPVTFGQRGFRILTRVATVTVATGIIGCHSYAVITGTRAIHLGQALGEVGEASAENRGCVRTTVDDARFKS